MQKDYKDKEKYRKQVINAMTQDLTGEVQSGAGVQEKLPKRRFSTEVEIIMKTDGRKLY